MAHAVKKELRRFFRPEFLNRIDEIIVFKSLSEGQMEQITRLLIGRLNETLERQRLEISLTEAAVRWIVNSCKDPQTSSGSRNRQFPDGARPLRRAIQKHIEDEVSKHLIKGRWPDGGKLEVYPKPDEDGQTDEERKYPLGVRLVQGEPAR